MGDTLKLRAPENSGPFTRNGVTYEIDADGNVEVPGDLVAELGEHGFGPLPVPPEEPAPTGVMSRAEMFAFLKAAGAPASNFATNDTLAGLVAKTQADQAERAAKETADADLIVAADLASRQAAEKAAAEAEAVRLDAEAAATADAAAKTTADAAAAAEKAAADAAAEAAAKAAGNGSA